MSDFERQFAQRIRDLDTHDQPDQAHKARLQQEMNVVWSQRGTEPAHRDGLHHLWRAIMNSPYTKIAAVIIFFVVVWISLAQRTGSETQGPAADDSTSRKEVILTPTDDSAEQKLRLDLTLAYQSGEIQPLIEALSQDNQTLQIIAAQYLGQLGAIEALEPLTKLAEQWQGLGKNPFAEAIDAIQTSPPTESRGEVSEEEEGEVTPSAMDSTMAQPVEDGVLVTVVAQETGEPLTGLEARINQPYHKSQVVTDEQGQIQIQLSDDVSQYLEVTVEAEGRVPTRITYNTTLGHGIPKAFTLNLEQGTSIGGFIYNEDDKPIDKATVHLLVPNEQYRTIQKPAIRDYQVTTDANGFWHCDIMPSKLDDVWIRLTHPDYIDDKMYGLTKAPSMSQLRDMTGVMVMKRGVTVSGWVLDVEGLAIGGTSVVQGSDRWGSHYPSTKTNAEGYFEFVNESSDQEMILTVQAEGYAPELRAVWPREDMNEVVFNLEPGYIIAGVVVDRNDKPIAESTIVADTWRGHRSIQWSQDTDAQGRFAWVDAPKDEVQFDILKSGFMRKRNYPMSSSSEEYHLVLHRPMKITGHVVDASTGEPIQEYTLMHGFPRDTVWDRDDAVPYSSSTFELTLSEPRQEGHAFRVDADGYESAISRTIFDDEESVRIEFALKHLDATQQIRGMVSFEDGEPAGEVDVFWATAKQNLFVQNGQVNHKESMDCYTQTQTNGQFKLVAPEEDYLILAMHDRGYAIADAVAFSETETLILEPWARVEGILNVGNHPGAREDIGVNSTYHSPHNSDIEIIWYYRATTDAQGCFIFNRVCPGALEVSHDIQTSTSMRSTTQLKRVSLQSGQTGFVELGGRGCPVVGQVVVPNDYDGPIHWGPFTRINEHLGNSDQDNPPYPPGFGAWEYKQQQQWRMDWFRQRRTVQANQPVECKSYPAIIREDGTFRVEDVLEGHYTMSVSLHEPTNAIEFDGGRLIGWTSCEFEVPFVEQGYSEVPVDLGTLQVELIRSLNLGDLAPLFEAQDIDGQSFELADLRDQFVLLDFWYLIRPQTGQEVSLLKQLADEFDGDSRLVMVSITQGMPIPVIEEFAKHHQVLWTQIALERQDPERSHDIMLKYDQGNSTSKYLIGPDGTIVAGPCDVETIVEAVRDALSQ